MFDRSVNKVILVGNLGKAPEMRYMPNGSAVASLTLATTESWKDKQTGERKDNTEWHRLSVFNRLGEMCGEYLKKGSKIYIEGKLQTRKWQGQDGQDRYSTEIVVSELQILDKSENQNNQQSGPAYQQPQQPQQPQQSGPAYQQPGPAYQQSGPAYQQPGPAYQQPQNRAAQGQRQQPPVPQYSQGNRR